MKLTRAPRERGFLSRPALLVGAAAAAFSALLYAGSLSSVTPTGASAGIPININGTGFNTAAAQNEVIFAPAAGLPIAAVPSRVVVASTLQRITVTVPPGVPVGPATLKVVNKATGETSEGLTLDVLDLRLPTVSSAPQGTANLDVEIIGSANSKFVAGSTRAVFGAGVTVHSTTVTSPTTAIARISVAATAALGPRTVGITSPNQQAILDNAFAVTAPGTPVNRPPTANAGGPYAADANVAITFNGSGNDPDGDPITLSWNFGDGTPDSANGVHAYATPGTYTVTLTVRDDKQAAATSTALVTISSPPPTNRPPTANAGGPYAADANVAITFNGSGNDPDGDPVTLSWNFGDGTPDSANGVHAYANPGTYTVTLTVRDDKQATATATALATISSPSPTNVDPTIVSQPVTAGTEGQPYAYDVDATDPDQGDALTYSLTTAPSGMTIDATTGAIVWTPGAGHVPSVAVTVRVEDGKGGAATQSFNVAIGAAPVNRDPSITSSPVTAAAEGEGYAYDVNATDPDAGDMLTFSLALAPSGMTISAANGLISWTPDAAHVPSVDVRVRVSDGKGGTAEQNFTIAVAAANRAPQITSAPVTTAREQLAYSYQVQAIDANKDPIAYVLKAAPQGMTIDAAGLIAWTPPVNPPATVTVTVVVLDPANASDSQTFDIAVTAATRVNRAPIITSSPNLAAESSQPYSYDVNATDADAGDTLTYALVQPPAGMTINSSTGVIGWTPSTAQVGPIAVTVRVTDGIDFAQQAFEVTVSTPPNTNRLPAAHAGGPYAGETGAAIQFDGKGSSDPDGDALSFSWNFGDGSAAGSGDSPTHAYKEAGSFTVTLTVSDGRGGTSSRSTSVAVGTAGDRAPPAVSLIAPREVLPGANVTVTAEATDNVKVDKVRFEVDGGNPSESSAAPFQRAITVPSVATPGTEIQVRATATDPSGNTGTAETTLTIKALPDTEKPAVTLNAPPLAAPGATILVSATATDNSGVQSVAFSINDGSLQTISAPPYEATFTVPADAPVGAVLNLRATARDFSNNEGAAIGAVTVVSTPDTQAPTVQLNARATAVAGALLDLTAIAADNRGIANVAFYVDGVKVATDADAPYAAAFAIPPTMLPGSVLQLEARAVDFAGLEGTDSGQTALISTTNLARGVLTGEVYDDTTGLPLEGATVSLGGSDIGGSPYALQATTDARGRYLLTATEGSAVLTVTRAGWTRVDRTVDVIGNKSTEVLDARLTPLAANATAVSPALGATISSTHSTLIIPPGVLGAPANVALTVIGQQGIQGLLPAGWSPIAVADVTPHDVAVASSMTLTFTQVPDVPATATLVFVVWDDDAAKWRVVATAPRGTGALAAAIPHAGQYAWLIGDVAPAAPPAPVVDGFLAGVIASQVPTDATSIVSPESKVVFYQPGISTEVTGLVNLASKVPSGTVVFTRISEAYQFTTGQEAFVEPYAQDIVLYQPTSAAAALSARYRVTPSLSFEAATLQSGVITVELFDPPPGPRLSDLVTTGGGSAAAPTGERADVPPNAVASPVPLVVQRLSVDDIGLTLPDSLSYAGGVHLSTAGAQFTGPITLSVPKPAQLPPDAQILIARISELNNATRLMLVAIGQVVGDRIESSTLIGGNPSALEGVRGDGRYVFLRPASIVGFASGVVRAVGGNAFQGALVSSDTLPLFALSGATGQYVAAASTGPVSLVALDIARNDTGQAQAAIAANAVAAIDLLLGAQPPRVTSVTPANQAVNVPLSNSIVINFSEPLNPASVTPSSVLLTRPDGTAVVGTLSLSNNNSVVTLRPSDPLPGDTPFTISVATSIADLAGYTLAQAFTSQFTSLDVTAPPPPPAGAISASIPGSAGTTTVQATQGTAGLHDTVTVFNVTRNEATPVLVDPNGGFSVIVQAALTDVLQLRIVDPAGNDTVLAIPRFTQTNADGSLSAAVGKEGGRIEGPGGTVVDVPAGAFPEGAVVTVKPVSEAEFPVKMTAAQREVFGFSGGLELDFGGKTPNAYLNVSVPAAPGDTAQDQFVLTLIQEVRGIPQMTIVDTARVIAGQIRTSSPPCPGVTGQGTYGFLKSSRSVGLNYAQMESSAYGGMQANIEVSYAAASFLLLPYLALSPQLPHPVCYPVLTGRVTVKENSVRVIVPADQLAPADRRVVVNGQYSFPRDVTELTFNVPGQISHSFSVSVTGPQGDQAVSGVDVRSVGPGVVRIILDPDTITVPVTSVKIVNTTTAIDSEFFPAMPPFSASVAGGVGGTYAVTVVNTQQQSRPVTAQIEPSEFGDGRLVAIAVEGTIDPTAAEMAAAGIEGRGRKSVVLNDLSNGSSITIPASEIENGGFKYAFDGDPSHQFSLTVVYDDGFRDSTIIPTFRITVTNALTGRVIRTLQGFAPPRDEPLNLGVISDDIEPPTILSGPPLSRFDPSGLITFTFSEAMNADSVKANLIIEDSQGNRVQGEVRISAGNTVATFVPLTALKLGEQYRITLVGTDSLGQLLSPDSTGMKDRSGNSVATTRLTLKTYSPTPLPSFAMEPIIDLGFQRKTENEVLKTYLVAVSNTRDQRKIFKIDVTNPEAPAITGWGGGGSAMQRMTLVRNVDFATRSTNPCGTGSRFTGDLAITSTFNTILSFMGFWDVNGATPCLAANKLLTATPETLADRTRRGTVHALGFARGVAAIPHNNGYAAYAAVGEIGLMAADIGQNIPEYGPTDRVKEGMYPGDYFDVVAHGDRLLAVENTARRLDIFDPNLALLLSVDLPDAPRKIAIVEDFPLDDDLDGEIEPSEILDIAIVAGHEAIHFVDITKLDAPQIIGNVRMSGITRFIDVDKDKRRLFATSYKTPIPGADIFSMIDLAGMKQSGLIDPDGDGFDNRIIWKTEYPNGANSVRVDAGRGLAYIGTSAGFDTWAVYDNCCDLGVDFTAQAQDRQTGEREPLLQKEKDALRQEISAGLGDASECGISASTLSIIEQGSGACLWKDNPAEACGNNYQPGISDHDFEVFFPASTSTGAQQCTIKKLTERFIDETTKEPKRIELPDGSSIAFEDITFFPMPKDEFEDAKLNVNIPENSGGSDQYGDFGLGRQQLLLKWLLEGQYVEGEGLPTPATSLEAILTKMRTETKIPRLEGHEWGTLQWLALAKAKVFVRIKGAESAHSSLNGLFIKQLHDAGKAGIRATLARLVADPKGNELALKVTRELIDSRFPAFEENACIAIDPDEPDPNRWIEKPCGSFEEYVASAAARSLRGDALGIFTRAQVVDEVRRFYQVKADIEQITTEAGANEFIALTANFVEWVRDTTESVYEDAIGDDPERDIRVANLQRAKQLTDEKYLKEAKLAIVPRLYNRGFRTAENVLLAMYTTASGAQPADSKRVTLQGGDNIYVVYERDSEGGIEIDEETGEAKPEFALGPIDQTAEPGVPKTVVFTLDLGADEHKVKEANRENNYDGFFYYVLNRAAPAPPATPGPPPLPIDDPLDPDPECLDTPRLQITQSLVVNGQELQEQANIVIGETVTAKLRVRNLSSDSVTGVRACTTLTNQCYDVGSLASGQTGEPATTITATPNTPAVIDATPTTYGDGADITTGNSTRLVVGCEPYRVVPLNPNPNPSGDLSVLMRGGRAFRWYRVINRDTGQPIPGASVTVNMTGANTGSFTFTTDDKGIISTGTEPGMAIPYNDGMSDGTVELKINNINSATTYCAPATSFAINYKPFDYSEGLKAATTATAAGSLLGGTLTLGVGGNIGATLGTQRSSTGTSFNKLTFARGAETKVGLSYKADLFDAGLKLGGSLQITGPSATAGLGITSTMGDKFAFNAPLQLSDQIAIGGLLFDTMLKTGILNPAGPLANYILGAFNNFVTDFESKRTSYSLGYALTAEAGAGLFKASLGLPVGPSGSDVNVRPSVSLGLSGAVKSVYGITAEHIIADDKLNVGVSYTGEGSAVLGLSHGYQTEVAKFASQPNGVVKTETLAKETEQMSQSLSGGISGGLRINLTLDMQNSFEPSKLDVAFLGRKTYGWKITEKDTVTNSGASAAQNGTVTRTYSVSGLDEIVRVLDNATSFGTLLDDAQRAVQQVNPDEAILIGPVQAFELLQQFIANILENGAYTDTFEHGDGLSFPVGIKIKVLGTGIDLGATLAMDHVVTKTQEKGVFLGGRRYKLENYESAPVALDDTLGLIGNIAGVVTASESIPTNLSPAQATPNPAGGGSVASSNSARLDLRNDADFKSVSDLFSYPFQGQVGPLTPRRYAPDDVVGDANKPHYGFGGFHNFEPVSVALIEPARLTLDYYDPEVAGIDESQLRIYRWNADSLDWDYIGGTPDPATNTVATDVTRLGIYTLGLPMPARSVTWTVTERTVINAGLPTQTTRVRMLSNAIAMNTGGAAAGGAVFHVTSASGVAGDVVKTLYGTVLTDADPSVPGAQVTTRGDGRLEIEVEFAGSPSEALIIAFADGGTAFGEQTVNLRQP